MYGEITQRFYPPVTKISEGTGVAVERFIEYGSLLASSSTNLPPRRAT
ncbi:MAG: hypothetical protein WCF68_10900 [Terriglobales bacterium]